MKSIFPDPLVTKASLLALAKKNGLVLHEKGEEEEFVMMDPAKRNIYLYANEEVVVLYYGFYEAMSSTEKIMRLFGVSQRAASRLATSWLGNDNKPGIYPNSRDVTSGIIEMIHDAQADRVFMGMSNTKRGRELSLPVSYALHLSGSYPQQELTEYIQHNHASNAMQYLLIDALSGDPNVLKQLNQTLRSHATGKG